MPQRPSRGVCHRDVFEFFQVTAGIRLAEGGRDGEGPQRRGADLAVAQDAGEHRQGGRQVDAHDDPRCFPVVSRRPGPGCQDRLAVRPRCPLLAVCHRRGADGAAVAPSRAAGPSGRQLPRPGGWPVQGGDHGGHGGLQRLVLPDPYHPPARRAERRVGGAVPFHVPAQFRRPVPLVDPRVPAMFRADVPETPVHEHRDPARGERDVRADPGAAVQVQPEVLAEPVTPPVQGAAQRKLGFRVGPPVGPHVGRASRAGRARIVSHGAQG